jgi:ankyrin repeat protein
MAANDITESDTAATRHCAAGPINASSGSGGQINNTISGGSGNTQYNATNQHFHGIREPDESQLDDGFRKTLFLTSPEIDRNNLIDIKEGRVSNTCEWIRTTKEYKAFREGAQRLLWIWGEPGKGKTMMSIFISQDLELEKKSKTIYFFCRAEHEKRNTAVAVLRGLLWHLTGICPELTRVLRKRCETATQDVFSSRESLWTNFRELLAAVQAEQLYCVIDGLDECDESSQQWLARKLLSLHDHDSAISCSLVILSRYLVELKQTHQVNLDSDYSEKVKYDVKVFVKARTKKLFEQITFSTAQRNELRKQLFERAQGSFLWVGFVMMELLKQKNENGAMRALRRLPAGLFPLYDRMLRDIEPDSRELSLSILRYVAMACRTLTLDELAVVVSCRSARSRPPITGQNIRNLVEGCGPLFHIKEGIVALAHESIRDYAKEASFPDGLGSNTRKTHFQFAWACIDSLAQENKDGPLTTYATHYWPYHTIEVDRLAVELFSHPSCFFAKSSELRSSWWHSYDAIDHLPTGLSDEMFESMSHLHMACFLGIKFWAEDILDKQKARFLKMSLMLRGSITKRDRSGWTALHWAAFGDRVATVELLLNRKANPDTRDTNFGGTALHWAAQSGHAATVELLLHHMGEADAKDKLFGWTALHLAACHGHQTVAKLLLEFGANVDLRMCGDRTALHEASRNGHTALVKLLIDQGADCNAQDEKGETALYSATHTKAAVKLLLDHGADPNVKDKSNRTPLHQAASYLNKDTIRLLSDHGANVNAIDGYGQNILYYAFERYRGTARDEAAVKLLLEHHADINATNRRGQTTLLKMLRSYDSKPWRNQDLGRLRRAVRAMVEHGAQFDVESAEGKRILQLCREESENELYDSD